MVDAVAAVDLGATSGRVMLGYVGHNELSLRPVARFANGPVAAGAELHWDITRLYGSVLDGLAAALREEQEVRSIGVDSWAVDYALLRGGGRLGEVFHYRDDRNEGGATRVHGIVGPDELYARNGLQYLSFNTLYQFAAEKNLAAADSFLLVPDLFSFWLTGRKVAERSNASTTGLLNVSTREWDDELISRLGFSRTIFPELVDAGRIIGPVDARVAREIGARAPISVTAVGSHDTASAVVAIPSTRDDFAYISCGTWGLVGVELDRPVLSEASRLANFTNEGGVDGRVRYLHNVMGLWLLSESVRDWEADGTAIDLPHLVAQASAVTTPVPVFDANDPEFLAPGNMTGRISAWFERRGIRAPQGRPEFARSIIESLAAAFADAVAAASALSGKQVSVIHLVGGGSQNALLCQLTADRSGLPVKAGPVEATAIGNILVQARAIGSVSGDLEALRALVVAAFEPLHYSPRAGSAQ
ncbi:MAG: rhamnulokinase [Glaciihabitans sp.]|nr:rhamnulokinase [Glaciihabitans sp.]